MTAIEDILRSYTEPRQVFRRKFSEELPEATVFAYLAVGCLLLFVARIPVMLANEMAGNLGVPLIGVASAQFFGIMFLAPILFYLVAAISNLVIRLAGPEVDWLNCRVALFWTILAVAPVTLLQSLVESSIGSWIANIIASFVVLGVFLWIWISGLRELVRLTEENSETDRN